MATKVPHAADNPERIKAEIERTRQQLGDTVERLVAKTEVKRRARAEVTVFAVPLSVAAGMVLVAISLAVRQRARQQGKGP